MRYNRKSMQNILTLRLNNAISSARCFLGSGLPRLAVLTLTFRGAPQPGSDSPCRLLMVVMCWDCCGWYWCAAGPAVPLGAEEEPFGPGVAIVVCLNSIGGATPGCNAAEPLGTSLLLPSQRRERGKKQKQLHRQEPRPEKPTTPEALTETGSAPKR